jgi:hypothetical protein
VHENTVEMQIRTRSKCDFIDDRIGTDQVSMNGIGIESRSHRKYPVMDKKVGFSTYASRQVLGICPWFFHGDPPPHFKVDILFANTMN